ncbi:dihydrolipoyl dehydrogenase [Clostridium sp. D2Q-11]|uniref:Dihydrolipoyl dehydrogenase n=1 Tax=Anaeromonas frigoriresistens TaxID=2683708 RepID=A0A942Z5N8_9FIRM|nr:dihydrolipoyl dehydrogenase [Anaeromonas frigoriresistens]MBS4537636.1 dihydrolipoyl dehydrogenase [Anaeromonas frigoriresistens]
MLLDIKLEKLSGHANSGKVGKVHVNINDNIEFGDEILEVESNKGNSTIVSNASGIVKSIEVETGDTVKKGEVLVRIEGEVKKEDNTKSKPKTNKSTNTFNYMGNLMKPKKEEVDRDITIIGAGPGGYVAAIQAAKMGAKVAIIEKERVGGTCLNWGCIPTKAFVTSAKTYKDIRKAENFGLYAENVSANMKKIVERKNGIVKELTNGIEYLMENNNISLYKGKGEIVDNNTIFVKEGNKEVTINTENIILATGSKVSRIPIPGIDSSNILTSKEILDLEEIPKKLIIVGGGVIGMEFAFLFNNFGVDVTVVEYANSILDSLDKDIKEEISDIAKEEGIKIYSSSRVEEIMDTEDNQSIVVFKKEEKKHYITGDTILLSVGRHPNIGGVDLEKYGIQRNDNKRGIKVNEKMQTSIPNIYAIGDVTDKIQLAHVASHQGIVAVENILGKDIKMDYNTIPSAIFTDPEIAVVGLSEKEAQNKGIEVIIGKFPFGANGKALTLGEAKGFVKIIKEKESDKIIGGAIIGPHATDLIHEIAVAIKNNLRDIDLINTIHAHPTTAESIHEAILASTKNGSIHN